MSDNPFVTSNPFNESKQYVEPSSLLSNVRVSQEGDDTVVRIPTDSLRRIATSLKAKTSGGKRKKGKTNKNKKSK